MRNIFKASLFAASALILGACSSDDNNGPDNTNPPAVVKEVSKNVIYQANPAFFGTQDCLKGLDAQLDRIADMNCDILWLMPIYVRGELNGFGSPYSVKDYKGVNPKYGTLADVKTLVNNAHSKGMKVLFDWVANHTSWDNPWITEYPDRYQHDANGNIISPAGWPDVAQLNMNNPSTREAMIDAMLYWVKEVGIDGYRCDYVDGVPQDFWKEAIAKLREQKHDFIMLAETSNYALYQCGFDMIYDWNSGPTIHDAFTAGKGTKVVEEAKEALSKVPADDSILRYAFNHDIAAENNFDTYFGSVEAIPAAYVCASMLNGTPMIYSGMDALGIKGKLSFFDYRTLDFSTQLSEVYGAINKAYQNTADLRAGTLGDYSTSSVVCFTRTIPGRTLFVAVNVTDSEQTLKTPISLVGSTLTDQISGVKVKLDYTLQLEPYSYLILAN